MRLIKRSNLLFVPAFLLAACVALGARSGQEGGATTSLLRLGEVLATEPA